MRQAKLDATDIRILEALRENGRIPLAELGRAIGLSQPSMSERVKRLEESGVISGYEARLDHAALGLGLAAIIRLSTDHSAVHKTMAKLRAMKNVTEILRVTGEDCLYVRLAVRDTGELETVVDSLARHGLVKTSVILSEERKHLGLGGE